MVTAKVSPKGQVIIPAQLRRQAGMEIGSEVIIEPSEEGILIFPVSGKMKQKRSPLTPHRPLDFGGMILEAMRSY